MGKRWIAGFLALLAALVSFGCSVKTRPPETYVQVQSAASGLKSADLEVSQPDSIDPEPPEEAGAAAPDGMTADLRGITDPFARASAAAFAFLNSGQFPLMQYELGLADYNLDGMPELVVESMGNWGGSHTVLGLSGDCSEILGGYETANGPNEFFLFTGAAGETLLGMEGAGGHGFENYEIRLSFQYGQDGEFTVWEQRWTECFSQDRQTSSTEVAVLCNDETMDTFETREAAETSEYGWYFAGERLTESAPFVLEGELASTEPDESLWDKVSKEEIDVRIEALEAAYQAKMQG